MSSTFTRDRSDRAFERLYQAYGREVYRYVLAMVRNPAEAEDVTQATFLNAYRALRAGAEPRAPHNWLIAIAHNTCRSSVRRAMRRPQEVPLGEAELAVADRERPNVRELLRALRRLPFNQRSALTMRELEGLSYPEIAETLGVTVPAVEALLARARRTLRTQAGTLRGLAALLLPRSLRSAGEGGGAGGALGAGMLAKAAAVVLVGAAGFATANLGARPDAPAPQQAVPRPAAGVAAVSSPAAATGAPAGSAAGPGRARTLRTGGPGGAAAAGPGPSATPATAAPAPARAVSAPPAAGSSSPSAAAAATASGLVGAVVVGAVEQAADGAVASVTAAPAPAPVPAVPTVAAPEPPAPELPAPDLPAPDLPTVPAPTLPVEPAPPALP
jgi:RNA polymerase sigma factor (sigma-70 family)